MERTFRRSLSWISPSASITWMQSAMMAMRGSPGAIAEACPCVRLSRKVRNRSNMFFRQRSGFFSKQAEARLCQRLVAVVAHAGIIRRAAEERLHDSLFRLFWRRFLFDFHR